MDKRKIIYYSDESEEFSLARISPREIGDDYVYCHNSHFKRFTHFFWYRIVAMPLAWLYLKLIFGHKVIGRKKLREYRGQAHFLYGNHTQDIADALIPHMLDRRIDKYTVVHPNNVSMPVLGRITPSLGALPLPSSRKAYRNFFLAIERRVSEGAGIVVYPEAHIWPYYTGIRNFPDASFSYPVRHETPVFCFTNVYKKRRLRRRPRIETYIDGPFFHNPYLSVGEARARLRDDVYERMKERAALSDVEAIKYVKKEE